MFIDQAFPEYTAEERAQRAEQARAYLADPFFQSVMAEAEAVAISSWISSGTLEQRERAFLLYGGIQTIVGRLQAIQSDAPPKKDS